MQAVHLYQQKNIKINLFYSIFITSTGGGIKEALRYLR